MLWYSSYREPIPPVSTYDRLLAKESVLSFHTISVFSLVLMSERTLPYEAVWEVTL